MKFILKSLGFKFDCTFLFVSTDIESRGVRGTAGVRRRSIDFGHPALTPSDATVWVRCMSLYKAAWRQNGSYKIAFETLGARKIHNNV